MSFAATSGSRSDARGRRRRAGFLLAAAIAVAGCVAGVKLVREGSGFDHGAHAKRDLSCADCHADATKKPQAGMPALTVCLDCHDPKTEKPETKKVVDGYELALAAKTFPSADVRGPTYTDVKFDHSKHTFGCTTCHTGARDGAVPNPAGPQSMDTCLDCHKERGAKQDCAACHEKLGKEGAPKNHDKAWELHHGLVSRAPDKSHASERCDLCHTQSSCDACHAQNAPKGHTQSFRVATHGLEASMDRSRCLACHQADSCDRCHRTEPPRSHRAGFGSPRSNHCNSCHLPLAAEGCVACHRGTTSHERAKPKPLWHNASMVCTSCHGATEALPHVPGSMDCNSCHH